MLFYFNIYFILFHFILFYLLLSFFLSFFFPILVQAVWKTGSWCSSQAQGYATEVGEESSEHRSTRDLPAPRYIKWQNSPRDLHLNAKTHLHSMISKLQCSTPYAKQLARQEHNPIH